MKCRKNKDGSVDYVREAGDSASSFQLESLAHWYKHNIALSQAEMDRAGWSFPIELRARRTVSAAREVVHFKRKLAALRRRVFGSQVSG